VTQFESAPPATPLLAEPVLVVRQKLKLVELRNEYGVFDRSGRQIGAVVQAIQSPLAFLARLFTSWDVALPMLLEIRGPAGPELLVAKPWFTWRCQVTRPDGMPLGQIVKQIRLGKARFAPPARSSARSAPRTGGPRTSASATAPAGSSPA
jgi:hypothetical protein